MISDEVDEFWQRFTSAGPVGHRCFAAVSFGDSTAMADALADLIMDGRKRATAGLRRASIDHQALAEPGDHFVVIDGRGGFHGASAGRRKFASVPLCR